jgi:predicted metal-binding membrane protein
MGRVSARAAVDRGIEAALRRDRILVLASLAILTGLAWLYLWLEADAMDRMMMGLRPMAMQPTAASAWTFLLVFAMWTVMMAGMMLPSAASMTLFYAAIVRKNGERGSAMPSVWIFGTGYLLVWTAFSLGATALQALFEHLALASSMMVSTSKWLTGVILVGAGLYQWSPLKDACLGKCRTPLEFVITRWRPGRMGALRMGAAHGIYCVGCCWALMMLLFVGGVMNLPWVLLVAAFVLLEKVLPHGRVVARGAGAAMVAAGVYILIST